MQETPASDASATTHCDAMIYSTAASHLDLYSLWLLMLYKSPSCVAGSWTGMHQTRTIQSKFSTRRMLKSLGVEKAKQTVVKHVLHHCWLLDSILGIFTNMGMAYMLFGLGLFLTVAVPRAASRETSAKNVTSNIPPVMNSTSRGQIADQCRGRASL